MVGSLVWFLFTCCEEKLYALTNHEVIYIIYIWSDQGSLGWNGTFLTLNVGPNKPGATPILNS